MAAGPHKRSGRIRVVSYNVHSCIGIDGVFAPARIANVLSRLDADFIALQEVEEREYEGTSVSRFLADSLALHSAGSTTHERAGFDYGNVLLSRVAPMDSGAHDLSFTRREPRGAVDATFGLHGHRLRLITTHFGLAMRERRAQLQTLLGLVKNEDKGQTADLTVLCADFNEWLPYSRTHRALGQVLGVAQALRTFPSRLAVLSLDRIYAKPVDALKSIHTVKSAEARLASDHLPVVADFELE